MQITSGFLVSPQSHCYKIVVVNLISRKESSLFDVGLLHKGSQTIAVVSGNFTEAPMSALGK